MDGIVGVREAARLVGVHENTIRNWSAAGLLPVAAQVGVSGYRRFYLDDVRRLAQQAADHGRRQRRHVLRFRGLADGSIRVTCDNCRPVWARTFEPDHTDRDWVELSRQHSGTLHVEGVGGVISVVSRLEPR